MYNRSGFDNSCAHKTITLIREGEPDKKERRRAVSQIFGTSEEETETAIRRVVSVLCLNEYFKYVFGKSVTEAKKKELLELQLDAVRYTMWKTGSKKVPFDHLVRTIDFLLNEMR